jgi:hypothetical protein
MGVDFMPIHSVPGIISAGIGAKVGLEVMDRIGPKKRYAKKKRRR